MDRVVPMVVGALIAFGLLIVAGVISMNLTGSSAFISRWEDQLASVRPPASVEATALPDGTYVRRFSDDTWVAAKCASSCKCGNATFDALVVITGSGEVYSNTDHSFHGDYGLQSTLDQIEADSASEFIDTLDGFKDFDGYTIDLEPRGAG